MKVALLLVFMLCVAWSQESSLERKGLVYVKRGEQSMQLDLRLPPSKDSRPLPLVLVIHGGGWRQGARDRNEAPVLARLLTEAGYATAAISYRLAPKSPYPAQIEDCRTALQWLRSKAQEFGLDPARCAAVGASAGGHLAALLATEQDGAVLDSTDPVARCSTRVACAVSYFGPMQLDSEIELPAMATRLMKAFTGKDDLLAPQTRELLRRASPLSHVTKDDAPMLLVQGSVDVLVPPIHARLMVAKLSAEGVKHELVMVEGGGHGDFLMPLLKSVPAQERPDWWRRTLSFLEEGLRPAEPAKR